MMQGLRARGTSQEMRETRLARRMADAGRCRGLQAGGRGSRGEAEQETQARNACSSKSCTFAGPTVGFTPLAQSPVASGGLRMSTQGQGDGGVYFSTLSPASYFVGSDEYEENIVRDMYMLPSAACSLPSASASRSLCRPTNASMPGAWHFCESANVTSGSPWCVRYVQIVSGWSAFKNISARTVWTSSLRTRPVHAHSTKPPVDE